jgi:hypothetical protein
VNAPSLIVGSLRPKSTHCPAPGIGIVDKEPPAPPDIEQAHTSTIKDKYGVIRLMFGVTHLRHGLPNHRLHTGPTFWDVPNA